MSDDIYVTAKRAGTPIAGIPTLHVQLDNAGSPGINEANYASGAVPYMRFYGYIYGSWQLRQADLLVDTINIDPLTSTYDQYRIINIPETFPDQHTECLLDLMRGT